MKTMPAVDVEQLQPISRTYQYRKVMKPMLERKRRARINRSLDELKEHMILKLQATGENISKVEKADILEFTVQYIQQQNSAAALPSTPPPPQSQPQPPRYKGPGGDRDADCYRAGFSNCASEVSRFLALTHGVDMNFGTKLMTHLGHRLNEMSEKTSPLSVRVLDSYSPAPSSPASISSYESSSYHMPLTPNSMVSLSATNYSRNPSPCQTDSLLSVMDTSSSTSTSWSPSLPASPVNLQTTKHTSAKFTPLPVWRPW